MSDTVLVKIAPNYSSETINLMTITEPAYVFSCEYLDKDAYIWFRNDEDIQLYKKLQLAEGLLNEDSNFAGILAKEFRKRGVDFQGVEAILIDTNMFGKEEVFPVEKNSDIEEMVRAVYRRQEGYIVADDDLEDEILDRMYKVRVMDRFVRDRFNEEIASPIMEEQLKRVVFFSEEDRIDYFEKFRKQTEQMEKDFFASIVLHENSSEESKLYLELVKATMEATIEGEIEEAKERAKKIIAELKCI